MPQIDIQDCENTTYCDQDSAPIIEPEDLRETNDGGGGFSPLVHTIETSDQNAMPDTYRDYRRRSCPEELQAVGEAYETIDERDDSDFINRLIRCRTRAYFYRNKITEEVKVMSSCCRLRWCPFCAESRKYRVQEAVKTWLPDMRRPKFLTLTLKHTASPLSHQIKHLYSSFQKLRKSKYFRDHIEGGVWFFQIKQSENDGLWHPHLHCLIDALFMPRQHLSDMWYRITKTSVVVDIRQVKNQATMVDYVARYAAKPGDLKDMDIETRVELIDALHGRRLVGTWGSGRELSFRHVKQSDANDWQRLSDFTMVTARYRFDENARLIFNAWKNGTTLSEPVLVKGMAYVKDDHFIKKRIRASDSHNQLSFEFFR